MERTVYGILYIRPSLIQAQPEASETAGGSIPDGALQPGRLRIENLV